MRYDDIVVGGGHNGLAAAAYLARAGRRVLVLERADRVGGAAVSERVFTGIDAQLSRYAYLVSLLPRRIAADLDLDLRLVRRRVASYTPRPTDPQWGLLVDHGDPQVTARSFEAMTLGTREYAAWRDFGTRVGRLARRVWPTFLQPLRSAQAIRELVDDDPLWTGLTQVPLGSLLWEHFRDDVVRGVVATDGLIGTFASLHDSDLAQNVCFLYHVVGGGTGDWDVPVGGMGRVTESLARAAVDAGAAVVTGAQVVAVDPDGEVTWRERPPSGAARAGQRGPAGAVPGGSGALRSARGGSVLVGCAPAVADRLVQAAGASPLSALADDESGPAPTPWPEGSQLKVNMVLRRLPRLRDPAVDPAVAFAGTFHVNESASQLEAAYALAQRGQIPDLPPCEVYCHTLSDRSILGPELAASDVQTLTLFGLHLPARLFRQDPEVARRRATAAVLRSLASVLAEPVEPLLLPDAQGRPCLQALSPVDLETEVGLPGGHIFHRPLQWPWAQRAEDVGTWGVRTRYAAVRLCGSGARRGGGVSGIPGHNAARDVLEHSGD